MAPINNAVYLSTIFYTSMILINYHRNKKNKDYSSFQMTEFFSHNLLLKSQKAFGNKNKYFKCFRNFTLPFFTLLQRFEGYFLLHQML